MTTCLTTIRYLHISPNGNVECLFVTVVMWLWWTRRTTQRSTDCHFSCYRYQQMPATSLWLRCCSLMKLQAVFRRLYSLFVIGVLNWNRNTSCQITQHRRFQLSKQCFQVTDFFLLLCCSNVYCSRSLLSMHTNTFWQNVHCGRSDVQLKIVTKTIICRK